MTSFASYTPRTAAASSPRPTVPSSPDSGITSAVRDAASGGRVLLNWIRAFGNAVLAFLVGDSGIDAGWPCLRCSSASHSVRDFIANGGGVEGWRIKIEHDRGAMGYVIARMFNADPNSIVLHEPGEHCPRLRIGECDVCLMVVDLDAITDGCPVSVDHFVASKRPKPRPYLAPASDADMT